MTECIHQISLIEECERCPGWTGERVYHSFAGSLSANAPYSECQPMIRRFYEGVARRWNANSARG